MKKSVLIALVSVAAIGAQAGVITNVGATDPSIANVNLVGVQGADTRSREVIRTDTQSFVMGQSFTLGAVEATEGYNLTDIYLRSYTAEDFSIYSDNLEIRVFSGTTGAALGSYSFDINAHDGGSTASDVVRYDWVKFTLDGGGLALPAGGSYSFLVGFDGSSGPNQINKWGFQRDDGDLYAGGTQLEDVAVNYSNWDLNNGSEWTGVIADTNDDFSFFVDAQVVTIPEPATLGLVAMVGTGVLFVRRRLIL